MGSHRFRRDALLACAALCGFTCNDTCADLGVEDSPGAVDPSVLADYTDQRPPLPPGGSVHGSGRWFSVGSTRAHDPSESLHSTPSGEMATTPMSLLEHELDAELVDLQAPNLPASEEVNSLHSRLREHLSVQRGLDELPTPVAEQLAKGIHKTIEALTRGGPLPWTISEAVQGTDPKEFLKALEKAGLLRLAHPRIEQYILQLREGLTSPQSTSFWWNPESPPGMRMSTRQPWKAMRAFMGRQLIRIWRKLGTRDLWNAWKDLRTGGDAVEKTTVISMLKLDRLAHMVLDAAIVGLFGLCRPFVTLEEGEAFDCNTWNPNVPLLEPSLFVPFPEVAKLLADEPVPVELRCDANGSAERSAALEAIVPRFEKAVRDTDSPDLAFIPTASPYRNRGMDKVCPPWHLLVGGSFYKNAGIDILERLQTFEEVVNGLPVDYGDMLQYSMHLAIRFSQGNAKNTLWTVGKRIQSSLSNTSSVLGTVVARLVITLLSITGPPEQETAQWKKLRLLLDKIEGGFVPMRLMAQVDNNIRQYAALIESAVLSRVVPVSVRAMALLCVGLWAKERGVFRFGSYETRPKVMLLLRLLLSARLHLGSVVRVMSLTADGRSHVLFANNKGIHDASLPLTKGRLLTTLNKVYMRNVDPLAPIKAAASLLNLIHATKKDDFNLTEGLGGSNVFTTRFAVEYHCAAIAEEVIVFLGSQRGRQMQREQQIEFVKGIVSTVAFSSSTDSKVKLRCAFSSDEQQLQRIIKAAARPGALRRVRRFFRRMLHGYQRLKRSMLHSFSEQAVDINEADFLNTVFVARRQRPGEWIRVLELETGVTLSALQQLKQNNRPTASLTEPLDLHALKNVQDQVAIAVDVDDTCISSGGWRVRGLGIYVGGVDSSYPRGVAYPGMGGLMYMLSMGAQRRERGKVRPVRNEVLPVVLASARPSTRFLFRPKSLYKDLARMYTHEAALLGAELQETGKKYRGMSKFTGLWTLLQKGARLTRTDDSVFHDGTKMMFFGDTYEKDLPTGISLGIIAPQQYVASLMHLVYADEPQTSPLSIPQTFMNRSPGLVTLPEEAFPFKIPIANSSPAGNPQPFIVGVSLVFKVALPENLFNRIDQEDLLWDKQNGYPCDAMDTDTVWTVGELVDKLIRRIWASYRHTWMHTHLSELLGDSPLPPPPVFVRCLGVIEDNMSASVHLQHMHRSPATVLKPNDLGTPIIPFTTPLGAMVTARVLGMLDNHDLSELANLVGRAERSFNPPHHQAEAKAAKALLYDAKVAAATIADLRYQDAPEWKFAQTFLKANGLRLNKDPNCLIEQARSYQRLGNPALQQPVKVSPRWFSFQNWGVIAQQLKSLMNCVGLHLKPTLQEASGVPQSLMETRKRLRISTMHRGAQQISFLMPPYDQGLQNNIWKGPPLCTSFFLEKCLSNKFTRRTSAQEEIVEAPGMRDSSERPFLYALPRCWRYRGRGP
ncbi:hypothetical protein cyc_02744 [Cyclospora cayetanensis]|uniref:Uncharacterized protein n=1 Tax=Cyclospora cayetanensis TaxID=88456 RepID=A0A1D3CU22_9EIME|nr:hypothetical protein cyc_02744 [Cyclospora cayetanensis]